MSVSKTMGKLIPHKVPMDPEAYAQAGLIIATGTAVMEQVVQRVEHEVPHVGAVMRLLMDDITQPQARRYDQLDELGALFDAAKRGRDLPNTPTDPHHSDRHALRIGRNFPMRTATCWVDKAEAQRLSDIMENFDPLLRPVGEQVHYAHERTKLSDMSRRWNVDVASPQEALAYQQHQAHSAVLAAHQGTTAGQLKISVGGKVVHSATHTESRTVSKPRGTFNHS